MSRVPKDRPHLFQYDQIRVKCIFTDLQTHAMLAFIHELYLFSELYLDLSLSFKIQNLSLSLSVIKSNLSLWDDWAYDGAFYIYMKKLKLPLKPPQILWSIIQRLYTWSYICTEWMMKIVYCEFLVELCCPPVNNVLIIKRTTTTPTETWSLSRSLHRWETYEHLNVRRARET